MECYFKLMAARYGLTDLVEILPNNAKKLLYL